MIEYTINDEKGMICTKFTQNVDLNEAKDYLCHMTNDPKYNASYNRLLEIDHRTRMPDVSQGNYMKEIWEKFVENQTNYNCAIVCSSTTESMIRILMHNSSILDSSVRFFNNKPEGMSWLETRMSEQKYAGDRL